jgi:hypothetical protein
VNHRHLVIPGRDAVASYDAQLRIRESITTIGSMDSGLSLREPRNDEAETSNEQESDT